MKVRYHDMTEEMVMNPDALPECMRGMRRYRIEYGGHAESCVMECTVYLPAHVDARPLIDMLNSQEEEPMYPDYVRYPSDLEG